MTVELVSRTSFQKVFVEKRRPMAAVAPRNKALQTARHDAALW
jgi:hypothetical protein